MLVIYVLANLTSGFLKVLFAITYGVIVLLLANFLRVYGLQYIVAHELVAPCILFLLSLGLWLANFHIPNVIGNIIKSTSKISEISYALYIIHFPLIIIFCKFETSNIFYWGIKLLLYFAVLFGFSYLLELKYQPFIKKKLYK